MKEIVPNIEVGYIQAYIDYSSLGSAIWFLPGMIHSPPTPYLVRREWTGCGWRILERRAMGLPA